MVDVLKKVNEAKRDVLAALNEAKEQAKKLTVIVDWLKALWDKVSPWLMGIGIACGVSMVWPVVMLLMTVRSALGAAVSAVGMNAPPR